MLTRVRGNTGTYKLSKKQFLNICKKTNLSCVFLFIYLLIINAMRFAQFFAAFCRCTSSIHPAFAFAFYLFLYFRVRNRCN